MFKKILLCMTAIAVAMVSANARTINIHGRVTMQGSDEPAAGIPIFNGETMRLLGLTDEEGKYLISADSEGTLIFSSMAADEITEPINGRMQINISLMPKANQLEEVFVTAKANTSALITEKADLEIEGNWVKIKNRVKIPPKLFSSEKRMVIQPALYNVSKRQLTYITPKVYDGWRFADTQERMYDWDKDADPLVPYRNIKTSGRRAENVIPIIDSVYVENPNDDFAAVILTAMEDYRHIVYTDSFEVARGTKNPFRFLKYELKPMSMNEEKYLPTPEIELKDAAGEMNLVFDVGKSNLDTSLGNNAAEIQALINEFKAIEKDPDMSLKAFTIYGYASPEGSYATNHKLANARMKSAMDMVLSSIDPSIRRNAEISSKADVAPWEDVVEMLRADSLDSEADQVQAILDKYSSDDYRSFAMARLPFFKTLLKEQYLPRLRKVNYNIVSTRYRPLTDEEIAELYVADPSKLSKYQFYRYYSVREGAEREEALRKAVATHPDFVVAVTDLSKILLDRGESAYDILSPFMDKGMNAWRKLPVSTLHNMGVSAMAEHQYSRADSMLRWVPESEETHKAKVYSKVMNGHYLEVMQEVCKDSPFNEVLILLKHGDNASAWRSAKLLGNSAVEEYVKAMAANRMDDYVSAITHFENAIKLDPSLMEIAKIDGDIVDLLEEEDLNTDKDEPATSTNEQTGKQE